MSLSSCREILNFLEFVEKETEILNYEIEDWKVWSILRVPIIINLSDFPKVNGRNFFSIFVGIMRRIKDNLCYFPYFLGLTRILFFNKKSETWDIVTVTYSDGRRDIVNGKYKCIYFDDIIENTRELKYFIIENRGSYNGHLRPVYHKVDLYGEGMNLYLMVIRAKLLRDRLENMKKEISKQLNGLRNSEFHRERVAHTVAFLEKNFITIINDFFRRKELYKELLKKLGPKLLIVACTGGGLEAIAAAKELGIKTVEVQHGNIHPNHPGYMVGKHLSQYRRNFPYADCVLTYGHYWNNIFVANSFREEDELFATGNTRIDFWRRRQNIDYNEVHRKVSISSQSVLCASQVGFLRGILEIVSKQDIQVQFVIKMHPNCKRNDLRVWKKLERDYNGRVLIIGKDAVNLYRYILNSDFHASVYSTTHYEAIALGKPTAVMKLYGWENVVELVESGIAKLVDSPDDFVELILASINRNSEYQKWFQNTMEAINKYQEKDAIKKNAETMRKIIGIS